MMNAHKMITLLLMLWTTSAFVHGQDVVTQMNSIKLDKSYVYGQATHENADTAYMEALNDLILSMEARTKEKVDVKQVRTKAQKLSRQRGNRMQVMVYVKVEENTSSPAANIAAAANHAEPAANIAEPTANIAEPAANIAEPTANIAEPTATVEPSVKPSHQPAAASSINYGDNKRLAPLVKEMMSVDNLEAVIYILNARKRSGTVADWAPYPEAEHPERMFVLVLDLEYGIPLVVLSPENDKGMRYNITDNNKEESLSLYTDYGALCFTMK